MSTDLDRWVAELDDHINQVMIAVELGPSFQNVTAIDTARLRNIASAWNLIRDEIRGHVTSDADEVVAGLESDHPLGQHENALRKLRAKFTSPSYRIADSIPVKLDEAHRILRTWDEVLTAWRPPQSIRLNTPPDPTNLVGTKVTLTLADGKITIESIEED